MKIPSEARIYETQNVGLASFLMLEGIRLIECVKVPDRRIVKMRFVDESQKCIDLERIYLNSQFKRFRDTNEYLLKKIHEKLRGE